MAKVFISYSRKDIEFAKQLTAELQKSDLDFWIDWEGIPPTVDWWREIEKGIEEADAFLFIISPDSAKSKVCGQEIDVAVKNGKRIIPIIVREIEWQDTPPQLGHLNYIFFSRGDDFDASLAALTTAIHTDYDWAQTHRRLQVKALEWERSNHEESFLLRGKDLQGAEAQLLVNDKKNPYPTPLQKSFIEKSREMENLQRELQHTKEQQLLLEKDTGKRLRRLRNLLIVVFTIAFLVLSAWLYKITNDLAIVAIQNQLTSIIQTGVINIDGDTYAGLIEQDHTGNPYYQKLREYLLEMKEISPESFFYTITKGSGEFDILIIASTVDNMPFKFKTSRSHFSELHRGLTKTAVGDSTVKDDLGTWMTACTPIFDSSHQSVGALCVDLSANYINQVRSGVLRSFMTVFIITYPIMLLLVLTTSQFFQKVSGRFNKQ